MSTIPDPFDLALEHHQAGRLVEAESIYRQILAARPDHADTLHLMGVIAHQGGRHAEAVEAIGRAIALNRSVPAYYNNAGEAYRALRELDRALACYHKALDLDPGFAKAHYNLGNALMDQARPAEAAEYYRRALALNPNFADAHHNLGAALLKQGRIAEAARCCRRALQLNPDCAYAHSTLGSCLKAVGRMDEAIACYRRAVELDPLDAEVHSILVYSMHFSAAWDAAALGAEARRWNQRHARPLAGSIRPHANDPSPDRRLRIGYVSPAFRRHAEAFYMLPLLAAHDHRDFEIFCYSDVVAPDDYTARLRACPDAWREIRGLDDEQVAEQIRQDGIDILVDLTMHLARNRLLVFARKPAPVQATYLAYCGTTGLETIDYRLTDPYVDPETEDDRFYSEESVRLPDTCWCYRPPHEAPAPAPLPALRNGFITFGCLSNFCKVSAPALAAWSRLLHAVPTARLLLSAPEGIARERVMEFFSRERISPERVDFATALPYAEYMATYHRIDVALDTFPNGGATTVCEALWMGAPLVSLASTTAVSRSGASMLSNVGLRELIAADADGYVRIAAELAADLPRLEALRATLRSRMAQSPLMDAPRFARNVEAAYRRMWHRWCAAQSGRVPPAQAER